MHDLYSEFTAHAKNLVLVIGFFCSSFLQDRGSLLRIFLYRLLKDKPLTKYKSYPAFLFVNKGEMCVSSIFYSLLFLIPGFKYGAWMFYIETGSIPPQKKSG